MQSYFDPTIKTTLKKMEDDLEKNERQPPKKMEDKLKKKVDILQKNY